MYKLFRQTLNRNHVRSTFLLLLISTFSLTAQDLNSSKKVNVSDYGKWENLGFRSTFSEDGKWFFYDIRRNNSKNEIRLHNLIDNTLKILPEGNRAKFSSDSKWLGYFVNPSAEERKNSKKPKRSKFRLIDLNSGDSLIVEDVTSFSFSDNSQYLAMTHYKSKGKESKGTDLVVRNLITNQDFNFGNVAEFSWQEDGLLLAMIIDADGKAGNGVQLFNPETGVLKVLDNDETTYSGLTWREESDDLAVFKSLEDENYKESSNHILLWQNLSSKKSTILTFDQFQVEGFPEHNKVITNRGINWSDDGKSIFFNIKAWEEKPKKEKKESKTDKSEKKEYQDLTDESPALQIWHSKDVKVIPEQQQSASRRRDDQHLSVWHIDKGSFVQLADEHVETVRLQVNINVAVGQDATPYEKEAMFGRGNNDIYTVNLSTGERKKVLTEVNYVSAIDPNGRYIPYVKAGNYFVYDIANDRSKNLTEELSASFVNQDDDHPTPEKRPYGFVAWEKGGASFFVHSKYDLWQLWADGSKARKITDGKSDQIRYRFSFLDFEDYVDQKKEVYLSMFGYWSKKSGYAKVVPGKNVKQLIWEDARVSRLSKAENADKFAYSMETFSDSPDFFVTSSKFNKVKQVSETNPFQKDYAWGKSETIEYTNANGKRLQGSLFYPANYEPGKKYPMITYIYELLSDGVHSYSSPSQSNYYSHTVFTQEGYFVLRPDIVFDAGNPGISSVRTMEAAVKAVVDKGIVDEKRVGLIGHSWGGYQAGYAVTQTDIFAASVAGAGLTNLTSMSGMIAWAFGGAPENEHFEVSQERMIVPVYKDVDSYIRNSSIFSVEKLNTPLLFEVGDKDQNVDWRQGIEYYNAARRARKQFVLLVYANEGHGLRETKNSADYQMRILKWFGHYLKGEEAAPWIEQGIPYEKQMETLKNWKK